MGGSVASLRFQRVWDPRVGWLECRGFLPFRLGQLLRSTWHLRSTVLRRDSFPRRSIGTGRNRALLFRDPRTIRSGRRDAARPRDWERGIERSGWSRKESLVYSPGKTNINQDSSGIRFLLFDGDRDRSRPPAVFDTINCVEGGSNLRVQLLWNFVRTSVHARRLQARRCRRNWSGNETANSRKNASTYRGVDRYKEEFPGCTARSTVRP